MYDNNQYYGWILKAQSEGTTKYWRIYSSEHATAANRPYLEITYNNDPDCGYAHKRAITIDHSKVIGDSGDTVDLIDFPVLIKESGTWLRNSSYTDGRIENIDGNDIIFKDSTETLTLAHEIEYYYAGSEAENGELVAWVKIPTLDANSNTVIYMYYGNSCVTSQTQNKNAVWNSSYKLVQHLQETSGTHEDSTANNNHSTSVTVTTQGSATGKIDGADDFELDSSNNITIGDSSSLDITDAITVEAWINPETYDDGNSHRIVTKGGEKYVLRSYWGDYLEAYIDEGGTLRYARKADIISAGYQYVVMTWDGVSGDHKLRLYYNGSEVTGYVVQESAVSPINTSDEPLYIGSHATGEYWDGGIDEVRISSVARTPGWIQTSFNNQNDTSTFYGLGTEEDNPLDTVTLSEASTGQITDQFDGSASLDDALLYRLRLYNNSDSAATVDKVVLHLTGISGIVAGDLSDLRIRVGSGPTGADVSSAPTVDITGDTGTITFDGDFSIAGNFGTNYFVSGDLTNLVAPDTLTISLAPSDVTLVSGSVGGTAPSDVTHTADASGPPWWNPSYAYREQITITAPASKDVPIGYPIKLTFDHASLYIDGKSQIDGDDIRIVYWNGSSWTELDRTLFNNNLTNSDWNLSNTTILFKAQADIPAGTSENNYYIYYGNPGASGPPTNTLSSRYFVAESLTETQTSSSTYATKVSLTFTPSDASEQWVVVGSWRQRSTGTSNSYAGESQILVNTVLREGTSRVGYRQAEDMWKTFASVFRITGVSSAQTVELQFAAYGGTDAIDNARLIAFMIPDPSNADVQYAENLPITIDGGSNPVDALTTTFSPSSAGDYIWMASGSNHEGPGGGSTGGLYAVDETDAPQQQSDESYIPQADSFVPFSHFEQRNLTTGSKSFVIRHHPDPGTPPADGSERQGLTMLLFRSDVFDLVEMTNSAADNSTTSTTYVDKSPALTLNTASVGANRDYIYIVEMGMYESTRDITTSTAGEVRFNGVQQTEDVSMIDRNGYNRQVTWANAETGTGGRTLNARYRSSLTGTQTAHALYGHIVSLRYIEPNTSLPPNLTQIHYRWRNDDGEESGIETVTVDGTASTGTATTDDTSITIPHTTSGSNRLMLVGVSINNDGLETVVNPDGITYNGVPLSFVGAINNTRSGGDDGRVEIWQLVAPSTGTHDVEITFSDPLLLQAVAGVMSFTGVDQSDPLGPFASNENDPSPATVDVQSAVNELVFGVVCTEYGAITTDSGQTEEWNIRVGSTSTYGAGSTKAGASTVTLQWALGGTPHWAAAGVSIKPASGSGATFLANEDTPYSPLDKSTTIRLRMEVSNEGEDAPDPVQYRLQYRESTGGTWTNVPDSAMGGEHWQMSASPYITDGEATSDISPGLTNENTTFVPGELRDATPTTGDITLSSTQFTEIEYSIEATPNATDGQTYYFRVTNDGSTTNFSYSVYPQVTLAGVLNSPPTAPTTPYSNNDTAQSGQTDPIDITDTSPAFSAIYEDPDPGDIANKYRVEVNDDINFTGTVMWDSGASGTTMADTNRGNRCPDIIYAGAGLQNATTYYWRIRFWDDDGAEGASATGQFTTTSLVNAAPTAPTTPYSNNDTAQSGQTDPIDITDTSPAFSAIYTDPDPGDIANKYRVEVNDDINFTGTIMWDSGQVSMADTTAGNRCPDIIYAGAGLQNATTYYWRIRFW
ncbi:MAG: hypothetical protein AMJ46_14325, partial [Latescibacteria bacterium DG_63]